MAVRKGVGKALVAASATPIVLAILANGETYGYAILRRVSEASQGDLQWSDGMLYPVLHRLERLGYIEGRWGTSSSGRRRKYYRITQLGRDQLDTLHAHWSVVNRTVREVWPAAHAKQEGAVAVT